MFEKVTLAVTEGPQFTGHFLGSFKNYVFVTHVIFFLTRLEQQGRQSESPNGHENEH